MASPTPTKSKHLTASEAVQKNDLEGKLFGKFIVMTGATSGIGLEAARALLATGATLFLTAQDCKKAERNLAAILETGRATLVDMDNDPWASVRAAAATILALSNHKVNFLIANAGINGIEKLTIMEDGHEVLFATNHLSHFFLFQLLKPALLASSTDDFHSKVVLTSSATHRIVRLNDSDNYNFEKGGYSFMTAYAHSNFANIYMADELERRYGSSGLHGLSLHPGVIQTEISRSMDPEVLKHIVTHEKLIEAEKTPAEGAATIIVAAVGKAWEGKGGSYLEDCEEAKHGRDDGDMFGTGWVHQTYDMDMDSEARLWKDSHKLIQFY